VTLFGDPIVDSGTRGLRRELRRLARELRSRRDIVVTTRGAVETNSTSRDALAPIANARRSVRKSRDAILASSQKTERGMKGRHLAALALLDLDRALEHLAAACRSTDQQQVIQHIEHTVQYANAASATGRAASREINFRWPL
jgi:hypothetical protein